MEKGRFIKADEAAQYLGIKTRTLYTMCQARRIPYYELSARHYLFDVTELDNFIKGRRVPSSAETLEKADLCFKAFETRTKRKAAL